jgi:putative ABC transport system permease protein
MRVADLLTLAWTNLRRNRTRSLLTGLGITIGVAALFTLLGFGAGLERTATQEFEALKLDRTLRVTSHPIPGLTNSSSSLTVDSVRTRSGRVPLTDSLVRAIEQFDGVLAAYPEMQFPARLEANGRTVVVTAEGIPMALRSLSAYQPVQGRFFEREDEAGVLIGRSMAQRLGYRPARTAVGDSIHLATASINFHRLRTMAELFSGGLRTLPTGRRIYDVRIVGLLDHTGRPVSGVTRALIPLSFGRTLKKIPFFSTLDLLFRHAQTQEGYSAVRVQLHEDADQTTVQEALAQMGVYVTSFQQQFRRLDTLFLAIDLGLGLIGAIALAVAVLGIANTVMMNVRERRREIGIMMAVGGDARDLQRLFVAESATLGVLGGGAGLLIGGLFGGGLDWGLNAYLATLGVPSVALFDTSLLAVLGIWGGAVLVSLLAGILPARRAAHIEPAEALRNGV